ncbi:FAD-binding oxidoreductase [Alloalcanivorax sp. C16-2]|uniref:2Fe-2S iron-sulfur cluster binding domain-containing protein n=1 Tax=Alloalcanivorax TaxID=3020832 RepID=UPI0019318177|nr:2Fe-2S iron-sulfur cluster binding domain-containing protein [Alloalcanivorax marinus]MBL7252633.1 2Fe-2S iron-sulfur cluster binding domain-containing protein [Alloalcanivorax marinus]
MSSKHHITCVFEDGGTSRFTSSSFETVYQAALRSGLTLETDCREGACGVCKAYLSDGECDLGDFSDEALSEDEEEQGYVLSCQARPRGDLVLQFGYPMSLLNKEMACLTASVTALEAVADNVMRLVLEGDGEPLPFLPGQYVNLSVPGKVASRSYSFANSPLKPGAMEFFVRLLDSGSMSDWLRHQARVGDSVRVEGPYGQFFLRSPRGGELLMVAGGTGLAPILSMLEKLRADQARPPKVRVLYGANHPGELFALRRLADYGDWVAVETAVVAGDGDWLGKVGFVTDLIAQQNLDDPSLADAYLCGPPPMIEAARHALVELGLPENRIFAEKFLPSEK